ncbi:MAG: hypothetical protein RJA63_165 [Pseudomonadota bacterium]|jgi:hypothetical protein
MDAAFEELRGGHGLLRELPGVRVWAWVDATQAQSVQSVVKATPGTQVLMPWQDAVASQRRRFVPGFDD